MPHLGAHDGMHGRSARMSHPLSPRISPSLHRAVCLRSWCRALLQSTKLSRQAGCTCSPAYGCPGILSSVAVGGSSKLHLDEGSVSSHRLEGEPDPASLCSAVVHDVHSDGVRGLALNKPAGAVAGVPAGGKPVNDVDGCKASTHVLQQPVSRWCHHWLYSLITLHQHGQVCGQLTHTRAPITDGGSANLQGGHLLKTKGVHLRTDTGTAEQMQGVSAQRLYAGSAAAAHHH